MPLEKEIKRLKEQNKITMFVGVLISILTVMVGFYIQSKNPETG